MLRSLTAPLHHTPTTTQRLHINWHGPWAVHLSHLQKAWHHIPNPKKNIKKCCRCFLFSNKPGNKWITDAVITNVGMFACEPTVSVHTANPRASLCVSYAELLLGNAEEFFVWPWTGSLCANHHFKFLRLPGAVHSSIKMLQSSQGDISETTPQLTSSY